MLLLDPARINRLAQDETGRILLCSFNDNRGIGEVPEFTVSVDMIESRTGLDFLSELVDAVERVVEQRVQARMW